MRLAFYVLAAIALAELFTFVLLRLKYGNDCSGSYQRRDTISPEVSVEYVIVSEPLSIEVRELLYAFELAAPHVKKGGTYATRLAEQQELALGLIDWAICEGDRGLDLLKAMTKPDELTKR